MTATPTTARLVPVTDDPDTGGFFEAAARRELVIRACAACGVALHLPRAYCHACGSWDATWRRVAGTGTLYSWTVVEHQVHPAYPVPYTIVLVELDDVPGVRLVGSVPGSPALGEGQSMRVVFEELAGGVVLPNWVAA